MGSKKRSLVDIASSLNYCSRNPVQGVQNFHCFHDEGKPEKHPTTKGVVIQRQVCCWCKEEVQETRFKTHGPHRPTRRKTV